MNKDITFDATSINLIGVAPKTKLKKIVDTLYNLIDQDIFLYSFNIHSHFYINKLVEKLTGLDYKLIMKYTYPCTRIGKTSHDKIDREKYLKAIEYLQQSKLIIAHTKVFNEDYVDYLLDIDSKYLIIDDFKTLLYYTKYSLEEVIKKMKESKKKIILFIYEELDYQKIKEDLGEYKNN